jgi:hypothetical protein
VQISDIRLSNVNGTIHIEAWAEDVVALETILQSPGKSQEEATRQIEDGRPEVIQHGRLLLIRARGEAQQKIVIHQHLRVPERKLRSLELNFVTGKATVAGVQSNQLKISSMEGSVTIQGEIAEAAEYDINTAGGSIDVELPNSAACTINASSVTGRLKCDLDLIDVEERANWISGVYNAAKADLRLNSIGGHITLTNMDRGSFVKQKERR